MAAQQARTEQRTTLNSRRQRLCCSAHRALGLAHHCKHRQHLGALHEDGLQFWRANRGRGGPGRAGQQARAGQLHGRGARGRRRRRWALQQRTDLEGGGHLLHGGQELGLSWVALVHLSTKKKGGRALPVRVAPCCTAVHGAVRPPRTLSLGCHSPPRLSTRSSLQRTADLGEHGAQAGQRDACAEREDGRQGGLCSAQLGFRRRAPSGGS